MKLSLKMNVSIFKEKLKVADFEMYLNEESLVVIRTALIFK